MFKELFATAILSTCLGAKTLQPDKAFSNQLNGGYCVRDIYTVGGYRDESLRGYSFEYTSGSYNGHAFWYDFDTSTYIELDSFLMDYGVSYPNAISISLSNADNTYEHSDYIDINTVGYDLYDDLPSRLMGGIIYFDDYFYVPSDSSKLFRHVFFAESNEYVINYTGWYSFNSNINSVNNYFNVYGNVSSNNTLYNHLYGSHEADGIYYLQSNLSINLTLRPYIMHDDTGWHSSQLVYFTGVLIPYEMRQRLLSLGNFNYIPDVPNTTLPEVIFSVVDAPVFYLYSLFNFDVFGTNLFIAFTSLVTLVVVIAILKKIL